MKRVTALRITHTTTRLGLARAAAEDKTLLRQKIHAVIYDKLNMWKEKCSTNKVKPRLCTKGLSAKGWQSTLRLNRDQVVLCQLSKTNRRITEETLNVSQLPDLEVGCRGK